MAQIKVQELAQELETTARTARKFLRHITPKDEQPGKGGRWLIEKRDVRSLKKKFQAFTEEHMREAAAETADSEIETLAQEEAANA